MQIRSLSAVDAEALFALRREALEDAPLAFSASAEDDLWTSAEVVRAQIEIRGGSQVFGAFEGGLQGMLGLTRARHVKAARKVFLWGLYVRAPWRGQGVARALLSSAVQHSRSLAGVRSVHVSATEAAPAARRLYESSGFRLWGTEPDSIQVGERLLSEYHYALRL